MAAALWLGGCDMPHDNPRDPASPAYRDVGTVAGRVTGIYPPFDGRSGVRVRLTPLAGGAEQVATTDADGAFTAANVPGGTYEVRAESAGYRADADTLAVTAGETAEATLRLDALPVVTRQSARTVHIERWFPDVPVFQLEVDVDATDPDRAADVDGAALVAEGLAFREALVEAEPGRFTATLDADRLPGGQVQALLGRTLRVEVTDRSGNTGLGPPLALVRVIEQTPLTASPQGLVTITDNPPVLEWRPAPLPFAFTYRVDIALVDAAGVPNEVLTRSAISSAETRLQLPTALAPGDYTWSVWVVDAAGNRSRSKPAGFRVP